MSEQAPRPLVSDRPSVLFHYTTSAGLLGIVESRSLFATDVRFMNDRTEIAFGAERFRQALVNGDVSMTDEERDRILNALDHLLDWFRAFAVCFCADGDLLSQWRGYGADGGYAIGFRSESLSTVEGPGPYAVMQDGDAWAVVKGEKAATLAPVHYLGPESRGVTVEFGFSQENLKLASAGLLRSFVFTKDPGFAEEREWRLMWATFRENAAKKASHRLGPSGIVVPYLPLRYDREAVTEVVVGPGPHSELRAEAVQSLLDAQELENVRVRESGVPLR